MVDKKFTSQEYLTFQENMADMYRALVNATVIIQGLQDCDCIDNGNGGDDGNGNDNGGGDVDPPTVDNYWTEFPVSSDALVFYVASDGDDNNNGLSESSPFKTIEKGVNSLRNGFPDHLLFKRGDTFFGRLSGNWSKSGRSKSEKMIIGAYGDLSLPRPVINSGSSKPLNFIKNDSRKHLAFVSLEFKSGTGSIDSGISSVSAGLEDVLFEDILVSGYTHGFSLQGASKELFLRRCVILDNAGTTHSQGIYTSSLEDITIDECIIDRNGWRDEIGREDATIFAHNVYIQTSTKNLTFTNNISTRASSHGIQARNGGVISGNLLWQNPIGMVYGNEGIKSNEFPVTGRIDSNLFLEQNDISPTLRRRWAMHIQNGSRVTVDSNIFANSLNGEGKGLILSSRDKDTDNDIVFTANVIHNHGELLDIDPQNVENLDFINNIISDPNNQVILPSIPNVQFSNNEVLSNSQLDIPFMIEYIRTIGLNSEEEFFTALRNQRKGNWNKDLTAQSIVKFYNESV